MKEGVDGKKYWVYGGDFGDIFNDLNFCFNGFIWFDRIFYLVLYGNLKLYRKLYFLFFNIFFDYSNLNLFFDIVLEVKYVY